MILASIDRLLKEQEVAENITDLMDPSSKICPVAETSILQSVFATFVKDPTNFYVSLKPFTNRMEKHQTKKKQCNFFRSIQTILNFNSFKIVSMFGMNDMLQFLLPQHWKT